MIDFQTHPDRYHHWRLTVDCEQARLEMDVSGDHPFTDGYELKLNSYDLSVDIELADSIQRLRFEHPQVKVVTVTSAVDRVFCAGANIRMLAASSHPFKVNFCKYTNETRLSLEDASRHSGIRSIAAINGPCAGGGYELALACDDICLVDDNNSAVSLPEVPLLGVLPGTGGLTRLVDKRKVRRDLADVFCTLAEGLRGKKAKAWNLIDETFSKSKFEDKVKERAVATAATVKKKQGTEKGGIEWTPLLCDASETGYTYKHVSLEFSPEQRTATLTIRAPETAQPKDGAGYQAEGTSSWALQCFRELDDALCQLRFGHENVGLVLLKTRGDMDAILDVEKTLVANNDHWLVHEILTFQARVMRRYDLTARSFFALADTESCFGGIFLEMALASDRIYLFDDPDNPVNMAVGPLCDGALPMSNGLTRFENRFLGEPERATQLAKEQPKLDAEAAFEAGLATFLVEDLDWEDDVRIAIEERASLSPDALTGMEASLRFGGAETCDSKIFGRLSAWQNWIFIRPNATGDEGALVRYGHPEQARFDWRRT